MEVFKEVTAELSCSTADNKQLKLEMSTKSEFKEDRNYREL